MVRQAEEEETKDKATRQATKKEKKEAVAKSLPARTPGKSTSFLAGHEEEMVPSLLEALPADVWGTTKNIYKFWKDR